MKTIKILFAIVIALIAAQPVNAQKAKANVQANKPATAINTYTCPMHPDVTSDKPGKCSKCGMNLNLTPKEKMKMEVMKMYTCPMHPDVTSDKPGKCSKCNMELKETGQTASSYSCPMHPDVTSDKQGKCTKCGMNLNLTPKEKMKMEVMKMYTCPMHPEITSNNPGKCSKCNMNLTKGKTKPGN
jgi:uncharacterized paraquat-inducible protein A